MKRCPECKKAYFTHDNFCEDDGQKLGAPDVCRNCGTQLGQYQKFCKHCGEEVLVPDACS